MSTSTTLTHTRKMSSPDASEEPQLSLEVLTRPEDKIDALKLIGDSIAQQRQVASQTLIFHPLCLAALVAVLAIAHTTWLANSDASAMVITDAGLCLAYLLAVRYFTGAYIHVAESMDWNTWLKGPNDKDDVILGARYGSEIIATVVLRLFKEGGSDKGLIRAWTTRTRFRRRGLGGDMLREAVKVAKQRRGKNCTIGFAKDHANSTMVLDDRFNGPFKAREASAAKALAQAISEWETSNQK